MKNIFTVFRKELLRVLKDKRLIITLILPGILIFAIYYFLGGAFSESDTKAREAEYKVIAVNLPADVKAIMKSEALNINMDLIELDAADETELNKTAAEKKELLKTGEADVVMVFDKDFQGLIMGGDKTPSALICYNPSETKSAYAYQSIAEALDIYKSKLLADESVNIFVPIPEQVMDVQKATAKGFAMMIPFLIITFLFSGCMAVTPDAIAGEKERGTIATILITPIKRSELALGKIFALTVLSCISALSSFLGLIFSLPKLMGEGMKLAGLYSFGQYALILLVLLSTVLIIVGVMSILSSFAKSVREASMLILPFMLVSMVIGLLTMTGGGAASNVAVYFIPLYNSVQAMISILNYNINAANLIVTFFSNVAYLGICIFALTKLFNSEKIMFAK